MHRLSWYSAARNDLDAPKHVPLDLHHVVFRSLGGQEDEDNLVPLCRLCHRTIHAGLPLGRSSSDVGTLRELWQLWLRLGASIPDVCPIGTGEVLAKTPLFLNVYGIATEFWVSDEITYAEARQEIIGRTAGVLAGNDPHFPFISPFRHHWSLSTDKDVRLPWNEVSAVDVLRQIAQPISLEAPVLVLLNRDFHPLAEGKQRRL